MPRISADTVDEHVARQEKRVFETAVGLFLERGYQQVTFADIAEAVGLARNSLYRYFPGKAAILVRWLDQELNEAADRSETILAAPGPVPDRVIAWAHSQIEYARQPEHGLIVSFSSLAGEVDAETMNRLRKIHDRLREPLVATLSESLDPDRAAGAADLIFAMTNEASRLPAGRDESTLSLLDSGIGTLAAG